MILQWCIWLTSIYGITCLIVYLVRLWSGIRVAPQTVHVVVLSYNSEHLIEWTLRSLHLWSWLEGKRYVFTVIDGGSTDDTLLIVNRLHVNAFQLELIGTPFTQMDDFVNGMIWNKGEHDSRVVVMDIRRQDEFGNTLSSSAYTR